MQLSSPLLQHGNARMPSIHEIATVTSKGQITLPKTIRQALGIQSGSKIAFDLSGDHVIVTRVENVQHEDPAIGAFLALLENDIRTGKNISSLPNDLAGSMLASIHKRVDLNADIEGDVSL